MTLALGIDTGGTCTDAVVWDDAAGRILARAKALTTHGALGLGVREAIARCLAGFEGDLRALGFVALSTTLATNALVEGQGGRAALVFIGFGPGDAGRAGLDRALGGDPLIEVAGGHDSFGRQAAALDEASLAGALDAVAGMVEGVAVVANFGVRNPEHELRAAALARTRGLTVTCGHVLSAQLGGPKRALTTLLNARLVGMIERLIGDVERALAEAGVEAPLMVVRGDGSLVSAGFARERPIETILSGPAASVVGAARLSGVETAVVSDIGGTTTDIAILREGRPRLNPEGGMVGGFSTMVEAVDVTTHGLGGDSEVTLEGGLGLALRLGPRRAVPVSLAATAHEGAILGALRRQAARERPAPDDGHFAIAVGGAGATLGGAEEGLMARLADGPLALGDVAVDRRAKAALAKLRRAGSVRLVAFTPSDAFHVLRRSTRWHGEAARLAAALLARTRDGRGQPFAPNAETMAERVANALAERSARVVLDAALTADGMTPDAAPFAEALMTRGLSGGSGIARVDVGLGVPVIGLGASATLVYPQVGARLGTPAPPVDGAEVANAVGAVAGRVEIRARVVVTEPQPGRFRAHGPEGAEDDDDLDRLEARATETLRAHLSAEAARAGAAEATLRIETERREVTAEGRPVFVESVISGTAAGRPAVAEIEGAA